MTQDVLKELKTSCEKTLNSLAKELGRIRTGRANLALLDDVKVSYYGALTPLSRVASLSIADPKLIVIKPWDRSIIPEIEKGVNQAGLGLTPQSNGSLIRLPIPPLTEERRKELLKLVKQKGEESKISIRNHRRECNEMLKDAEKEKMLSEDELYRGLEKIQDETQNFISKVDEIIKKKEKEIMEV